MKAAFVGPPFSGKSALFSAVTSIKPDPAEVSQERQAVVAVPDPRLDFLAGLYNPKKITPATIEFLDLPGFSLSDAHGQDAFRKAAATLRICDVLVIVVRDFENDSVPAYRNRVDALADLNELRDELLFADLDSIGKRIEKLDKALKKPTKTHEQEKREHALLTRCHEALESNEPVSSVLGQPDDSRLLASFSFLTVKPMIAVFNVGEDRAGVTETEVPEHFRSAVTISAATEAEISELADDDRAAFLSDLGIVTPARDRLIQQCFTAMDYVSFLTMGPDEVRAWPIKRDLPAVEAAGKIHSDLARGFIRAETVAYDDLVDAGDLKGAKAAGKVRQEGKTYVVQDGDILNIKFNV